MQLRRKKTEPSDPTLTNTDASTSASSAEAAKKGRPTLSRKEAEAANRRPLVVTDRRAAGKAARAKDREVRDREYQALRSGDTAHLPLRDRGPVRQYIRDYVDARWSLGEYFLIVAVVLLVISILSGSNNLLMVISTLGIYLLAIFVLVDTYLMWRSVKRRLIAKFGEDRMERGLAMYAVSRTLQFRRWRLPRPTQARHGVYPD